RSSGWAGCGTSPRPAICRRDALGRRRCAHSDGEWWIIDDDSFSTRRDAPMAAQKPRTGDGPLEVTKEGRSMVLRLPVEGGGRLVIEISPDEAKDLHDTLAEAIGN